MKSFIYLVQGRSDLVKDYFHLQDRDSADAIFLTYDEKIDGAIYFPDSTWSEGRNKLLEAAGKKGEYLYYIICDDDIEFVKGSWDEFERLLILYNPAVGFPVVPATRKLRIWFLKFQLYDWPDQQMIAYHNDLISDQLILPYQDNLDKICWWGSGGVVNLIIHNFYKSDSLQFNTVRIKNMVHGRYDRNDIMNNFKICMKWFKNESTKDMIFFKDPPKSRVLRKIIILFNTIRYLLNFKSQNSSFRIDKNKLHKLFKDDSVFVKQYNGISEI